jgi:hypothetical protein
MKTTMQARHFCLIADVVKHLDGTARDVAAEAFANALANTNPKFNRERFLTACDAAR